MSAESLPITPARFRSALSDLPISSLYAKYSELQNSITHMESSNKQLEDYARDNDDRECYEAILENREVIKRFLERIDMLKTEVMEVRGLPWRPAGEDEEKKEENNALNGMNGTGQIGEAATGAPANGEQRTETQGGNDEEGVFL